jgi:flagella basal body P-ring formation protein FlgA
MLDAQKFGELVTQDLVQRGIISGDIQSKIRFDVANLAINAEAVDAPAQLLSLRYQPDGAFVARFLVAGLDVPIDLTGAVDLLVPAPRLTGNKPAGTILSPPISRRPWCPSQPPTPAPTPPSTSSSASSSCARAVVA